MAKFRCSKVVLGGCAVLVTLFSGEVSAGVPDLKLALYHGLLPPGGQTIGGPGVAVIEGGTTRVYQDVAEQPNVCITVTNVGDFPVEIVPVPAGGAFSSPEPGETRTVCLESPEKISLACDGSSCLAVYRVDLTLQVFLVNGP